MQLSDIDFVIIGAAKSATTWLQTQLQSDPAIYMPDPELHYFSREYERGTDWYLSQFSDEGIGKVVGEKSNSYLYTPEAPERVHRDLPHVKLIAQLRNPVARAYSSYCMLFRRGEVGSDIENYLDPSKGEHTQILGSGNFASYLQSYVDLYGREKLLILFFDGVSKTPELQMSKVRGHLGLPDRALAPEGREKVKDKTAPLVPVGMRKRLSWMKPLVQPLRGTAPFEAARGMIARKTEYPQYTDDLKKRVSEYYAPSIEALEKMSGQSLNHWYK
ncbi:sulfotransferase family protein [Aurantiacibacter rhizosphaerae]|uniref:Sulfotransferase n=1 Tax=Aurantiacibacter rhizosphaerae TaxID=2691582 RepID=A0A844XAR1_9SPHN|nr:sulfotransferase [Aurantiacibacter rhizosphaerae]MWV27571.1 sulfotransferase [Aurantiacibacter rhizosphaerae]